MRRRHKKLMQARPDSRTMPIGVGISVCALLAGAGYFFASVPHASAEEGMRSGMTCGMGISAAKAGRAAAAVTSQPTPAPSQSVQPATDSPPTKVPMPPGPAPEGMVWIAGGEVPPQGVTSKATAAPAYQTIDEAITKGDLADVKLHLAANPESASQGRDKTRTPLAQAVLRNKTEIASA